MSDNHKYTSLLFIVHDIQNFFLKSDDVMIGNGIIVALSMQGESVWALILKFINIQYVLLNIIGVLYMICLICQTGGYSENFLWGLLLGVH
jgi:hypothetical protein